MYFPELDDFLLRALKEDLGTGDITTQSCIADSARSRGVFRAKESGVVCGLDVLIRVFQLVDPRVVVKPLSLDGDRVLKGDIIAEIEPVITQEET